MEFLTLLGTQTKKCGFILSTLLLSVLFCLFFNMTTANANATHDGRLSKLMNDLALFPFNFKKHLGIKGKVLEWTTQQSIRP